MAGFQIGRAAIPLALLAGCASPAPMLPPQPLDVRIDVLQRDWHTDLCLDPRDLTGKLTAVTADFPGARFLCFGFGERQYMLEKDHSALAMLSSLLPSRAVLLVTPLPGPPGEVIVRDKGYFDVVSLRISRAGAANLSDVTWRSIQSDASGAPADLGPGTAKGSRFYAASFTYNAMTTCNTWTGTGLRAAGLPVNDAVIFVDDLMSQVRAVAKAQAADVPAASAGN